MSVLVTNIPPVRVWVRREYLRDLRDGFGEYVEGYWVTAKSVSGQTFYFETFLPEYGAMFDKLPISAFLIWESDYPDAPRKPEPDLPLESLCYWNCFDKGIRAVEKNLVYNCQWEVRTRFHGNQLGSYLLTLDCYCPFDNDLDLSMAHEPAEHKSFNIIALENGQIGAYPNNRCRITDPSLCPESLKQPDFLVSSRIFDVEYAPDWGRLGHTSNYFWTTETEDLLAADEC